MDDMTEVTPRIRWAMLWRADNQLDGRKRQLQGAGGNVPLFRTRQEARDWIEDHYGYIRTRPDLQAEPHGWKMPIPVKVSIAPIE